MTVKDDGPYEAEDDGGPSVDDVRDVYVHQFDLSETDTRHHQPSVIGQDGQDRDEFRFLSEGGV